MGIPKCNLVKELLHKMANLLKEVEQGAKLKAVETVDKSAPAVEGATLKKDDTRDKVKSAIAAGDVKLKNVETVDKSAPKIESDVKVEKFDPKERLAAIEKGVELKKAETVYVKSGIFRSL